jgi:4-hydroxythreonine-4-phosphate dehydrogenase
MVLGDPCGIGPEVSAKLLASETSGRRAELLLIGDYWVFEQGQRAAGTSNTLQRVCSADEADFSSGAPVFLDCPSMEPEELRVGEAQAPAGRCVLACLGRAIELAREDAVDAILFAPLNKQAMHLAGYGYEDEMHWFADELGYEGPFTEFNVLDRLWTSRVTSHVPLSRVAAMITEDRIVETVALIDAGQRDAGIESPRIAVAGLNPHAGDGGIFGREEIDIIAPAVERARARGIRVQGPFPSDTVFLRARDGDYDAVVTMYHDQGQIAMKLMGFERGVTVLGGLPVPIATPAHGSAFDIAGQGVARADAMEQAFRIACRMGERRRVSRPS